MIRNHKKLVVILFFILLSTNAYAINLGSVASIDSVKIQSRESARFKLLFWNSENESYNLELSLVEAPKDWAVFISPQYFNLSSLIGDENIKLPYKNEYIKATSVSIIVKPTEDAKPGIYSIIINANSIMPQNDISLSQERLFKLTLEIENPLYFESKKQNVNSQAQEENQNQIQGNFLIRNSYNYQFYTIIIFIILIISFLIYKYS